MGMVYHEDASWPEPRSLNTVCRAAVGREGIKHSVLMATLKITISERYRYKFYLLTTTPQQKS